MRSLLSYTAAAIAGLALVGCQSQDNPFSSYGAGLDVLIVDVNGDGTDDVIIPRAELTAVDGVTVAPLWSRPSGDGAKAATKKFLVLANQRAVEVAALADGVSTGSVPLSDRVESLVADGEAVWVRTIDGVVGKLDPAARVLDTKAGPAPERPTCTSGLAACEPLGEGDFRLRDGELAVRFEFKKQGTRELTIVGESGGATTFTRVVDPNGLGLKGAELAGGIVYLALADTVLAIDVKSGAPAFELTGRPGPLRVVGGRLYVETDMMKTYKALEVLDARTGAPLFVLGDPLGPLRPVGAAKQ
jgi:hypothetical protein